MQVLSQLEIGEKGIQFPFEADLADKAAEVVLDCAPFRIARGGDPKSPVLDRGDLFRRLAERLEIDVERLAAIKIGERVDAVAQAFDNMREARSLDEAAVNLQRRRGKKLERDPPRPVRRAAVLRQVAPPDRNPRGPDHILAGAIDRLRLPARRDGFDRIQLARRSGPAQTEPREFPERDDEVGEIVLNLAHDDEIEIQPLAGDVDFLGLQRRLDDERPRNVPVLADLLRLLRDEGLKDRRIWAHAAQVAAFRRATICVADEPPKGRAEPAANHVALVARRQPQSALGREAKAEMLEGEGGEHGILCLVVAKVEVETADRIVRNVRDLAV